MSVTVQVPITNNFTKIIRFEAHRRLTAEDMNILSGTSIGDSNLEPILQLFKAITGEFNNSNNVFFGFGSSFSTSQITTNPGFIVNSEGIYKVPGFTFIPNDNSYFGLYEIEIVKATSNPLSLEFFDGVTGSYQDSDTRTSFTINVYEKYNSTSDMPTVTLGRIPWLEYKKTAPLPYPSATITDCDNFISSSVLVLQSDFDSHINNVSNPHSVKMSQLSDYDANDHKISNVLAGTANLDAVNYQQLSDEAQTRADDDGTLQGNIDDEADARALADSNLQDNINNHTHAYFNYQSSNSPYSGDLNNLYSASAKYYVLYNCSNNPTGYSGLLEVNRTEAGPNYHVLQKIYGFGGETTQLINAYYRYGFYSSGTIVWDIVWKQYLPITTSLITDLATYNSYPYYTVSPTGNNLNACITPGKFIIPNQNLGGANIENRPDDSWGYLQIEETSDIVTPYRHSILQKWISLDTCATFTREGVESGGLWTFSNWYNPQKLLTTFKPFLYTDSPNSYHNPTSSFAIYTKKTFYFLKVRLDSGAPNNNISIDIAGTFDTTGEIIYLRVDLYATQAASPAIPNTITIKIKGETITSVSTPAITGGDAGIIANYILVNIGESDEPIKWKKFSQITEFTI